MFNVINAIMTTVILVGLIVIQALAMAIVGIMWLITKGLEAICNWCSKATDHIKEINEWRRQNQPLT